MLLYCQERHHAAASTDTMIVGLGMLKLVLYLEQHDELISNIFLTIAMLL